MDQQELKVLLDFLGLTERLEMQDLRDHREIGYTFTSRLCNILVHNHNTLKGPDGIQGIKGDNGDMGNPVSTLSSTSC